MTISHSSRPIFPKLLLGFALAMLAVPASAQLRCESVPRWTHEYLKYHVSQNMLSPEVERRTIEIYVQRIDPSRSLLLESEASAARAALLGIFERMQRGDCQQLISLHEEMALRHRAVEEAVRSFVMDESYELDESVELVLDPEEARLPATAEEREALLHSLIHFQMSNYLSAGESDDEAKRLLTHRYDLRTERFSDLDASDLYAGFLDSFASSLDPHSNYSLCRGPRGLPDLDVALPRGDRRGPLRARRLLGGGSHHSGRRSGSARRGAARKRQDHRRRRR